MNILIRRPPARHPRGIKLVRIWHRRWREPLLTVLLTIQIVSLFVVPSIRAAGVPVPPIAVFGVLLVFVTLAIMLSRSHVPIILMILSVILTIIGVFMHREHPDLLTETISSSGQILAQFSLLWLVSTAVFGPGRTTYHRILGGIIMYLGLGMVFTTAYVYLVDWKPLAFAHVPIDPFDMREALTYFSFSTLTTGSFGDILPVHPIARSLANFESICGQLFPATLLARIVSMHSTDNK